MLKKIIQLLSKGKFSEDKTAEQKNMEQSVVHLAEPAPSAAELRKIGNQYFDRGDLATAELYYKQALDADPSFSPACLSLGLVRDSQGKLQESLKYYDQAIALKPDYAEAYNNRGLLLNDLKRFEEALISLDRAIVIKPDLAFAHNNRGMVLRSLYRYDEALTSYDLAISLNPEYADAFSNRGHLLAHLNKAKEAFFSYDKALSLMPDKEYFYGHWLRTKRVLCDWRGGKQDLSDLEIKISNGKNVIDPLTALALIDSPMLQNRVAYLFTHNKFPKLDDFSPYAKHPRRDKIRLGYFSAEFFNHAVSFLIAELFENHDKSKFELVAFSLSDIKDDMTKRIISTFDHFIDVSNKSDQEVALMAREMNVDIAIDLGGFTGGCRPRIFALRAAPVQVNYLGYPGTMGAGFMDYIIADATIIPTSHQQYYTEKVAYLPSFQANDTKREISDRIFTRDELGLPPKGFIFCCFNNITKIGPINFDSWMRILKQVEGSVLWLLDESPTAVSNLRKEATIRGVDGSRLFFAKKLPLTEYLARYRMADLFLDTLPFNAGTTSSDALWAGLPVLTQIGETFAGRMAASLLTAIHLPELIATTQKDYEALAVELAMNPDKLANIKQKLADNRLTTQLFDIDCFTNHIEAAYVQMYQRSQSGLPPDHINTLQKVS